MSTFTKGQKPGPGRPKGMPNKATKELKDMILAALDGVGGIDYLMRRAEDSPTAFLTLVGKVLPLQVSGPNNAPVRFELVAPWLQPTIQDRNTA